MSALGRILAYCGLVVLGGALGAPPLYWAGQWAVASGLLPALRPFGFHTYFNRAVLVCAVVGLRPLLRGLGVRSWASLGLAPNPRRRQHLLGGLALGVGGLALTAWALGVGGVLALARWPSWMETAQALATGLAVGALEETLFRGALFGGLRRRMPALRALAALSLLFAALHFVRPEPGYVAPAAVGWGDGLRLLPHLLWQFRSPLLLLQGGPTLLLVGWTLGLSVLRSRSLYLALGLHAGWVATVKWLVLAGALPRPGPWLSADLRGGLGPLLAVAVTLCVLHWRLPGLRAAATADG